MLRVLINFAPLKAGGGQSVAYNFLYGIQTVALSDITSLYLVAKDSG
jgi:hypothetical protein